MGDELPVYGSSSRHPWLNWQHDVAHPDAPCGGGGCGTFKDARPLSTDNAVGTSVPHPMSPLARRLTLDDKQRSEIRELGHAKSKDPGPVQPPSPGPAQPQAPDVSSMNDAVKAAADAAVGQPVVGDGECFALVDSILKKEGGKSAGDFGKVTRDADYAWGTEITEWKDVRPGDILQFRNHVITTTTETTTKRAYDDSTIQVDPGHDTDQEVHRRGLPNHTSIVSSFDGHGSLTIVEQHVIDPKTKALSTVVRQNTLKDFQYPSSSVWISVPKRRLKDEHGWYTEEVEKKVTTQVTGTVRMFHPQNR